MTDEVKINRGLIGVYFDRSEVSDINGAEGKLYYRGYSIDDLAQGGTFEETAYLLIHGNLPNADQLAEFDQGLRAARHLPDAVVDIIRAAQSGHPMDVLRTAVSALGALQPEAKDADPEAFIARGIELTSQVPMIVATHHALRSGRPAPQPDEDLSHAANWLWMLTGQKPSETAARLTDLDFILHGEHGSNASTFAARVTVGTDAGLINAVVTAISTLAGPAHGGAAEDVMAMVNEIGSADRAAEYVKAKRKAREPVTGFGHRVYKTEDPRARHLRDGLKRLGEEKGNPEWYAILEAVVEAMAPYRRHGLAVNVDFYSGAIYQLLGIPKDLYVPIFAIGRVPGWVIQCVEQKRGNILIRPLTLYTGEKPRPYTPIHDR